MTQRSYRPWMRAMEYHVVWSGPGFQGDALSSVVAGVDRHVSAAKARGATWPPRHLGHRAGVMAAVPVAVGSTARITPKRLGVRQHRPKVRRDARGREGLGEVGRALEAWGQLIPVVTRDEHDRDPAGTEEIGQLV